MRNHLFCLTTDTDPDGLSGKTVNRRALSWEGLMHAQDLPRDLTDLGATLGCQIPMTWFIRADGQLRDRLGSARYLLDRYQKFWSEIEILGHELAWHPHLYRQLKADDDPVLITDPNEACDEIEGLWRECSGATFLPTAFRHGEGWHCEQTFSAVEKLGLICDSTAIPGRRGSELHPMNWIGAPNRPYFPEALDIRQPGRARPLIEVPMNTWLVQAPYDRQPQVRYMNPAVHEAIFDNALTRWEGLVKQDDEPLSVWVFVFHPDEVMPAAEPDALYARSRQALCRNIRAIIVRVEEAGERFEFVTITEAAKRWRQREVSKS